MSRWTEPELIRLREMVESGCSRAQCGYALGRSVGVVNDKCWRLGLRFKRLPKAERPAPVPRMEGVVEILLARAKADLAREVAEAIRERPLTPPLRIPWPTGW